MKRILLAILMLWTIAPAWAVDPSERLADSALEARARVLSQDLRCLVCRNETIDDSDAPLAHDIRVLLRERLKAGDTDVQVLDYMRARYGDFVLLKPPVERSTWLLWFGPLALLVVAGGVILLVSRRRPVTPQPLDAEERARLDALLGGSDK